RSSALFEQRSDVHNLSITLNRLGELHYERHDFPNAIQVYQRDLKIVEQLQDERAVAQALNNLALAYVSDRGFAQAQALLNRALALWEKLDDDGGQAMALWARAQLHFDQAEEPAGSLEARAKDR